MYNEEHYQILRSGVEKWNTWRKENPTIKPQLFGAKMNSWHLKGVNLDDAFLSGAELHSTKFTNASLRRTEMRKVNITNANFSGADLQQAHLNYCYAPNTIFKEANLNEAHFDFGILDGVDFSGATLTKVDFGIATLIRVSLDNADLSGSAIGWARILDTDLSNVIGLDKLKHGGPTSIGLDTFYKSKGKIPRAFLQHCNIPGLFIDYMPELFGDIDPLQFNSLFISYSHTDELFANKLRDRLQEASIRVWLASHDLQGGKKIHEQIFNAIHVHDRVLLILSENSMGSEWVATEIRKALEAEKKEKQQKLFPIRLVDFERIREWTCFNGDTGKDMAVEVREYFIPDFSDWKNTEEFEKVVSKLIADLKKI